MRKHLSSPDWAGEDGLTFFRGLLLGFIFAAPLWVMLAAFMGWL